MTDANKIVFKTGKEFDPNCGYVGLNASLDVSAGYDQTVETDQETVKMLVEEGMDGDYDLTAAECVELAEVMIARWQRFADKWKEP